MLTEIDRAAFEHELRAALTHLYDPAALRDSRLMALLGLETRADAIVALRRLLLDTIESLKPATTCRLNQGPGAIIISCTAAIPNSSRNSKSATIWV